MSGNGIHWLKRFLFIYTPRETRPDGRPLYAYKMRDDTYEALKAQTRELLGLDQRGRLDSGMAPLFCLYAAETFCREHAEGLWKYETVFDPLGMEQPTYTKIQDWIEKGLKWWGRTLLHNARGDRMLLVTIACEGGLPLRLLHREGGCLAQYFRATLESYYRADQGGELIAKTMARQQALHLPRSLRHDEVFHLAGNLIAKISELQPQVGKATDPIAALDQKVPGWRRDLPLRLEDQIAEVLLAGLVHRSEELAREAISRLCWRGRLRVNGSRWSVEKFLELPESPRMKQIAEWIGETDANRPRWRLLLRTQTAIEPMAWLTLVQGEGETARYRREWLRNQGLVLSGEAIGQPHRLTLNDGTQEYPLKIGDAEPWGDSPWIFAERGLKGDLEWVAEGSARTRAKEAWVLVAPEIEPRILAGTCERVGTSPELGRVVYRVCGDVEFFTEEDDRYRLLCAAESESNEVFIVDGETLRQGLQERPVYCGLPRIQIIGPDGRRRPPSGRIQWRTKGDRNAWRGIGETVHGRVWVRLTDGDGIERCRRLVDVVPKELSIETDIGTPELNGRVRVIGLAGAKVTLNQGSPAEIAVEYADNQAQIHCPSLPGVLPSLDLLLQWPGSEPIGLSLPYPQRGAFFRFIGRPLSDDEYVPLDRLGGIQLFIQDPAGDCHVRLSAQLLTKQLAIQSLFEKRSVALFGHRRELIADNYQSFQERLPSLVRGQLTIPLFSWQDRIASLLASTGDLEAQVRLSIMTNQGDRLACVRISRFDAVTVPDKEARCVRIPEDSLARLGAGWETRIRLDMIRLWAPGTDPITLQVSRDQPACWSVPDDLESGPWWIVGRDQDWARFRPLLWVVGGGASSADAPSSLSGLARVIHEPHQEQRQRKLDHLLVDMGKDPDHADWLLVFDYLRLAREFPPSSLDLIRRLIAHPRTLAQALLRANDQTFETVWSLSRQMPFLWVLISIQDWLGAATTYFGGLRNALSAIETGEEIVFGQFQDFRDRASARRPHHWRPLCDWLQERVFPNRKLSGNSELRMARLGGEHSLKERIDFERMALLGRHGADERWPQIPEIKQWADQTNDWTEKHPVFYAPLVAAHVSREGIAPTERLTHALRLLRVFDREWFDIAYAIALTMELAEMTPES